MKQSASFKQNWPIPGWLVALIALIFLLCLIAFYILFWPRHPGALRGGPEPQTQQRNGQLAPPSRLGANAPPRQATPSADASQPILPAPPVEITVPADSVIAVRTRVLIDSDTGEVGSRFPGTVVSPVAINGQTAIPQGSQVVLRMTEKKKAGFFHRSLQIKLALAGISVNGRIYPAQADTVSLKAGKNDNAVDGSDNPAPKGKKTLVVLPNTELTFTLTAPLTIAVRPDSSGGQ